MPSVSVITLTCNRLEKLLRMLERLAPQLRPGDEILVIDTGSRDGTRERLRAEDSPLRELPAARLIEHDAGGSWAEVRNFGVAEARGELIAFLDDDCLPDEDWLKRGRAALTESEGGADAVGGIARPLGIGALPRWWHPAMGWMVGLSVPDHVGSRAGHFAYPFTANLWARRAACRAAPFQELGGQLGSAAGKQLYALGREDAQWWKRLRQEGYRTRFDAGLGVSHAIDPARLDLDYLRRRAMHDGGAWATREGTREDFGPLAYEWWSQAHQAFRALCRRRGGWDAAVAEWRLHQLLRRRHGAALAGLAAKHLRGGAGAPRLRALPALALGGLRFTRDRAKTMARVATGWWWRSRPQAKQGAPVERLAVVAFGYLGDMLILQSALRGLMKAHPRLAIYVLTPPAGQLALGELKRLNLTITPADLKPGSRAARRWLEEWLERIGAEAIIAPYLHEPWGPMLTGIRRPPRPVVGFDHDQGLKRRRWLERLAIRVRKDLAFHEVENLLNLLGVAGLPCRAEPACLAPKAEALARMEAHPWMEPGRRGRLVMLNPDAGQPYKEWSDEAWGEVGRQLLAMTWRGEEIRLVINASRPHPELEHLLGGENSRVHWLRGAPLDDLVAWMSRCALLATVDAGPQHIAHALGRPSLTLFGPMDERRWRDYFARGIHWTLRGCAANISPEEKRGLAVNHEVLMIDPAQVVGRIAAMMEDEMIDIGAGRGAGNEPRG